MICSFFNRKIPCLLFLFLFLQILIAELSGQVNETNNTLSGKDNATAGALSADSIMLLNNKVKEYLVSTKSIFEALLEMERNSKNVPVNQLGVNRYLTDITLIRERFDKIMTQLASSGTSQQKDSSEFEQYYVQAIAAINRLSVTRPVPATPPPPAKTEEKGNNWAAVAAIGIVALVLLIAIMILLLKWQKKRNMLNLQKEMKRKMDLEMRKQMFQARHNQNRLKI